MARISAQKLNDEFNVKEPPKDKDSKQEVEDLKNELANSEEIINQSKVNDPDETLQENINRANRFLDKIEKQVEQDAEIDSRMLEVASQLINAVTTSANNIVANAHNEEQLDLKKKDTELKEQKLKHQLEGDGGGKINNQQNIIVSSREELLDMIMKQNNQSQQNDETLEIDGNNKEEGESNDI